MKIGEYYDPRKVFGHPFQQLQNRMSALYFSLQTAERARDFPIL